MWMCVYFESVIHLESNLMQIADAHTLSLLYVYVLLTRYDFVTRLLFVFTMFDYNLLPFLRTCSVVHLAKEEEEEEIDRKRLSFPCLMTCY